MPEISQENRHWVDYGFRLLSAKDNRPLNFEEFESKIDQMLFVSATPNVYEQEHELLRAEQIIRRQVCWIRMWKCVRWRGRLMT